MALSPRTGGLTSRAEGEIDATSGDWSHRKGRRQSHRAAALGPPVARGKCQGVVSQPHDRGDRSHRGRQRKHRRPRLSRSRNARRDACRTLGHMQGNCRNRYDVTVKGLFWLLEAFRQSTTAKRFMLIGGDARLGISSTTIRSRSPSIRLIAPIPAAMLCRRSSRR